jgi:hypothetical protein
MFRTNEVNQAKEFSLIYGDSTKIWRAIGLEMRSPYFLVSHAQKEARSWLHATNLLWGSDDVAQFCRDVMRDPAKKIIQLAVLIPNGKGRSWRMECVREVWTSRDADVIAPLILIGDDGRSISSAQWPGTRTTIAMERIYRGRRVTNKSQQLA